MVQILSAFALSVLVLTGCLRTMVRLDRDDVGVQQYEKSVPFFFCGLVQGEGAEVTSSKLCGKDRKLTALETKVTFMDGLLGCLTVNVYTPKTLIAYCSDDGDDGVRPRTVP